MSIQIVQPSCNESWLLYAFCMEEMDDEKPETFGQRLRKLAESKGLSMAELGVGMGMGAKKNLKRAAIWAWYQDETKPNIEQLKRICQLFSESPSYMLYGHKDAGGVDAISGREGMLFQAFRQLRDGRQREIVAAISKEAEELQRLLGATTRPAQESAAVFSKVASPFETDGTKQ